MDPEAIPRRRQCDALSCAAADTRDGEVGKALGVSRERARQLEAQAMEKLRQTGAFRREFRDYAG